MSWYLCVCHDLYALNHGVFFKRRWRLYGPKWLADVFMTNRKIMLHMMASFHTYLTVGPIRLFISFYSMVKLIGWWCPDSRFPVAAADRPRRSRRSRMPRDFTYISSWCKYTLFFFNFLFWISGGEDQCQDQFQIFQTNFC